MAKKVLLKVNKPASGDPVKGEGTIQESAFIPPSRTILDDKFDIRDRLFELIGSGNQLKPDDKAAIYGYLSTALGKDKAQKVMNHAYIFNTRPDVQKLPIEEKIRSFYTIGSNDPEVMEIIKKTKNIDYGAQHGFRTSNTQINQALSGRSPSVASTDINPEIQKKVMLKVRK